MLAQHYPPRLWRSSTSLLLCFMCCALFAPFCQAEDDTSPVAAPTIYDDDSIGTPKETSYYIVTKISAGLSILGSIAIVVEVLAERRHQRRGGPSRASPSIGLLLLAMSVADILFSAAVFIGNWAVPKDVPYMWHPRGNQRTCTVQGFVAQLGWAATPCFSLTLSIYFLLIVRYNWTQRQLHRLDPYIHIGTWLMSLIMAIVPLFWDMYNDSWGYCWVEPAPYFCSNDDDDWLPCERGGHAATVGLIYTIFPPWVCLFASTFVMFMLWRTLRQMETKAMRRTFTPTTYNINNSTSHHHQEDSTNNEGSTHNNDNSASIQLNTVDRKRSIKVARYAMIYLGVFYAVYVPDFIAYLLAYINEDLWHFWFDYFVYGVMVPLLGFFNFLVFRSRREEMHTRYGRFLGNLVCCFGALGQSTTTTTSSTQGSTAAKATAATNPSNITSNMRSSVTKADLSNVSNTSHGDVGGIDKDVSNSSLDDGGKPASLQVKNVESAQDESFSSHPPPVVREVLPVLEEDGPPEEIDQEAGGAM